MFDGSEGLSCVLRPVTFACSLAALFHSPSLTWSAILCVRVVCVDACQLVVISYPFAMWHFSYALMPTRDFFAGRRGEGDPGNDLALK